MFKKPCSVYHVNLNQEEILIFSCLNLTVINNTRVADSEISLVLSSFFASEFVLSFKGPLQRLFMRSLQWRIQILSYLIYSPCWPFSLQSFLLFLPQKRGGGGGGHPGPSPRSATALILITCFPENVRVL